MTFQSAAVDGGNFFATVSEFWSLQVLPRAMDKVVLQVGEYRGVDFDQPTIASTGDARPLSSSKMDKN